MLKEDAQVALIKGGITNTAHTPPLPPGRYWVLSDAKVANKHLMWNQPVDVGTNEKLVTLDERNAMPVD